MGKHVTPPPERLAEIQRVTDRARAGDPAAVPRLRELLDEFPRMAAYYGDLGNQAIGVWIALAAGNDLFLREALSVRVGAMRRELAGDNPTPVMELAADRVVMTWMAVNYFTAMEGTALAAKENAKMLAFRTKRRLQAERAHTAALGALVALKKLCPPAPKVADGERAVPALPAAGAPDLANRISGYFADLLGPAAAGRKGPLAATN